MATVKHKFQQLVFNPAKHLENRTYKKIVVTHLERHLEQNSLEYPDET